MYFTTAVDSGPEAKLSRVDTTPSVMFPWWVDDEMEAGAGVDDIVDPDLNITRLAAGEFRQGGVAQSDSSGFFRAVFDNLAHAGLARRPDVLAEQEVADFAWVFSVLGTATAHAFNIGHSSRDSSVWAAIRDGRR